MTEQLLVLSRKSEEPLNLLKRGKLIPPFKNYQRYLVEKGAILKEEEKAYLYKAKIDWVLWQARSFKTIKIVASDMDSTLITIECVDEIAKKIGKDKEVERITLKAMQGDLDFSQSLKERVALLEGVKIKVIQEVLVDSLHLSPGAETLMNMCQENGVAFLLLSGGFTLFTDFLQRHYPISGTAANTLEIKDNTLTGRLLDPILDAQGKKEFLINYALKRGVNLENTLAVGDGANDIPMLKTAGTGYAYRAKPIVRQQADVCIDFSRLDFICASFL